MFSSRQTEVPARHHPFIELLNGDLRCEVVPEIGGAIAGFWLRDIPVLRSVPAAQLQSPRKGGCFALLPYSNRIGRGMLNWRGKTYALQTSPADAPHAIHGVGWQRSWKVDRHDPHNDSPSVRLVYEHQPDGDWPFAFMATQNIRLDGTSLILGLSYCNTHDEPAPAGLGWHPYFVKRAGARIAFQTKGRWESAPDKLPSHRVASAGFDGICTGLAVDNCYDGWTGIAEIRDENLCVRITSDTNYLVAYTRPELDFVAIEPVTHTSNALQLADAAGASMETLGMRELASGQVMHFEARIQVRKYAT